MLKYALKSTFVAAMMATVATTSGCFGIEIDLPPVTLTLPVATNATIPDILKDNDKLEFSLPPVCDLPDLGALEQQVRDSLGRAGGLLDIKSVTLDVMQFDASQGNFDFLDTFTLTFTKDGESVSLSGDLSAQSNITAFDLAPGAGEEVDILDLIPGPDECLQASFDFTGSIPTEETVYSATMDVTITAVLRL